MPRLDDVARAAGVSKATASRALSGASGVSPATRARVQETAEQLGFRASGAGRRLATGVTSTIGVLSPAPDRWYFGSVLHGIADAADAHEQDVILYDIGQLGQGGHERIERFLRRGEVDGLLSITWSLRDDDLRLLAARGVPVATVGEPAPHVRSFSLDDAAAGAMVVDHLVGLGHRDVLHVSSATEVQPFAASSSDRRSSAYVDAMRRHGLEPRPVVTVPTTLAGAHAAARELLAGPDRPRAIAAGTDEVALGIVLAAHQLGLRVPEDLSITGVDDVPSAGAWGLTTVRQDPAQHGRDAVAWIMGRVQSAGDPDTGHTSYPPELVVRGSTAPRG